MGKDNREPLLVTHEATGEDPDFGAAFQHLKYLQSWVQNRIDEFGALRFQEDKLWPLAQYLARDCTRSYREIPGGVSVDWISGPFRRKPEEDRKIRLREIYALARKVLELGEYPAVRRMGIESTSKRDDRAVAVGVGLCDDRICWLDRTGGKLFWTLRPDEGEHILRAARELGAWLVRQDMPAIDGRQPKDTRHLLMESVVFLKDNPYTPDPEFAFAVEDDIKAANEKLLAAIDLMSHWELERGRAGSGQAFQEGQAAQENPSSANGADTQSDAPEPDPMGAADAKAEDKQQARPKDLMSLAIAEDKFYVKRVTLLRAIGDGRLISYRPADAPKNSPHRVSESEVAQYWPRKQKPKR